MFVTDQSTSTTDIPSPTLLVPNDLKPPVENTQRIKNDSCFGSLKPTMCFKCTFKKYTLKKRRCVSKYLTPLQSTPVPTNSSITTSSRSRARRSTLVASVTTPNNGENELGSNCDYIKSITRIQQNIDQVNRRRISRSSRTSRDGIILERSDS